jgi:hypothetical protein
VSTFFSNRHITIIKNPTAARLSAMMKKVDYSLLRAILTEAGDLFVWDADEMTHASIHEDFEIFGTRLDLARNTVNIVLAGGARELLCEPEQVAEFFEAHGHPGASMHEDAVVAGICDRETRRITEAVAIRRALPDGFETYVDIDPRIDWATLTQKNTDDYNASRAP